MKRNEIIEKINNNFYELDKAKGNTYRGKVFVVADECRIKSFHKTKRGAENKVKKDEGYSYFDEYLNELVYPSAGEVFEIKENELGNYNNAEVWENELVSRMSTPWLIDNMINDFLSEVTNEDLKKVILENAERIKKYEGVRRFAEDFKVETVEVPEVEEVEKIKDKQEIKETKKETIEDIKIVLNEEKNGVEIYFSGKPSEDVRNNLKSNGFRWSKYNKCWYAKQNEDTLNFANSLINTTEEEIKQVSEEYKEEKEKEIDSKLNELNINDIDSYVVDAELSKRENENGFFRSKDINHTKEIQDYFLSANNEVLSVLENCNDKNIEYRLKMALQRFKRDYFNNYIKRLQHKANNPSWAITGRAGRNTNKDQKMNDRYNKMLTESNEIVDKFNKSVNRAKNDIRKQHKQELETAINNTNSENYSFTRCKKQYNFNATNNIFDNPNHEESMTTYNNEFFIFKNWGKFRIYNNKGVEIGNRNSLKDAKKYVVMLIEKVA